MKSLSSYFLKVSVVFAVLLGAVAARAQYNPPSWWGVNDGSTTSVCYQFNTPSNPAVPDFNMNPFGDPSFNMGSSIWFPQVTDHQGVVGNPGTGGAITASLFVPNRRDPLAVKYCWLQFDYFGGFSVDVFADPDSNFFVDNVVLDPLGNGWSRATAEFRIIPQPSHELLEFTFQPGQFIDNLYFGTHCVPVPEPGTFAAIGLGLGLIVLKRKRK